MLRLGEFGCTIESGIMNASSCVKHMKLLTVACIALALSIIV